MSKKLSMLTIAGGLAFWITSIATSLLPIAAKYRAAFSDWSVQTVWIDSLIAGVLIAFLVSLFSLRAIGRTPTRDPFATGLNRSLVALVIVTVLIDVPRTVLGPGNALLYFPIGLAFNLARFLALGAAIGYLLRRQREPVHLSGTMMITGDSK